MNHKSTKNMRISAWIIYLLPAAPKSRVSILWQRSNSWVDGCFGLGELTTGILFAIPQTSILGALALSAHLGGVILYHIILGEDLFGPVIFTSFWFQSLMQALVWLVTVLRYPGILSNFEDKLITIAEVKSGLDRGEKLLRWKITFLRKKRVHITMEWLCIRNMVILPKFYISSFSLNFISVVGIWTQP